MGYEGKAEALAGLNRMSEAKSLLDRALKQARLQNRKGHEAQLLILLGKLSLKTGDRQQALEYFETAGGIGVKFNFYRRVADAMFELAKLYRDTGDLAKVEARLSVGLEASRRVGDRYYLPRDLTELAELKVKRGDLEEAGALYEQTEDVVDGLVVNIPGPYLKSSVAGAMSEIYLGHFALAAERQKNVQKAFGIIERIRGRTAAEFLRGRRSGSQPEAVTENPEQKEVANLQIRLMRAASARERRDILDSLMEAEEKFGYFNDSRNPARNAFLGKPVQLEKLQASLLSDEILLEYVLNEPKSFCVLVSREHAKILALRAGRKRIEDLVEAYLGEIKARKPSAERRRELYSLLLAPVAAETRELRFVIVPDGMLNFLPFDSLVDLDGRYVLESHVVTHVPSGTVLHFLRTSRATQEATQPFLGVGGVTYGQEPTLLASNTHAGGSILRGISRGLYDLTGFHLQNLPGSRDEVIAASKIFGNHSLVLLGRDATESAFKSQPLADFKVLHLAVHGVANTKFPERVALVLASDPRSQEDGLLQAREIRNLDLNADLVTLSACDTGVGRLQGQEGIANLVQAFLFAGAKGVVATSWSVDDKYTTALMERFYTHLAQNQDKGSALRQAKIDLLNKSGDRTVPFYWAGFTLVGEGSSPISFSKR